MTTTTAFERVVDALEAHGLRVTGTGRQRSSRCPAHEDQAPSLSVTEGESRVLIKCHAGCNIDDILAELSLSSSDLFDSPKQRTNGFTATATYPYVDETGTLLFNVLRGYTDDSPKTFRQRLPNGVWKLGDTRRVLYRLPRVLAALTAGQVVYIVEGERDVAAVEAAGEVATCNPSGAGKWQPGYSSIFDGHEVVVVADKDKPGREHADQVRKSLESAGATVSVVEAADGKDAADHLAAGRTLDELVPVFPVPGVIGGERGTDDGPPLYVNIAGLFDDGLPDAPEPEFLRRSDDQCLFYAGQVNMLFGDPESGKTLVALAAAAETLKRGRKVAVVDIDHNGPVAILCRLIEMGVDESILRNPERFRYVEPEDKLHLVAVVADLKEWRPDIAVVDSIGELLPLMRLSSNSPDDFTATHALVLKPLAMAGVCVIAIDHLPKNIENRASGPTGTAAKRRAVGGVALRVTVDEQFTPGKGGKACLTINKDRHGGLRRNCPMEPGKESIAGWFKIAPKDDCISWTIESPATGDVAPRDRVDPLDLDRLNELDPPPKSVRDVKARCNWRTDRAMLVLAQWKRSQRSPTVPREQGTGVDGGVPPFPPYDPGNGEHGDPDTDTADNADSAATSPPANCTDCGERLLLCDGREHCAHCRPGQMVRVAS